MGLYSPLGKQWSMTAPMPYWLVSLSRITTRLGLSCTTKCEEERMPLLCQRPIHNLGHHGNSWSFWRSWLSGWRIQLRLRMLIILWRALSWVKFSGHGVFLMASILSSVGEIPSADMTQHIKVTGCFINLLLLRWSSESELIKQQGSDSECAVHNPVSWSECHLEWLQHAQDLEEWCSLSAEKLPGMMQYQKVAFCSNTDQNVY